MSEINFKRIRTWEDFQQDIIEVLIEALLLLRKVTNLYDHEDDISRELHFCIMHADYNLEQKGKGTGVAFSYQANNQPHADDKYAVPREKSKPDFTVSWVDHDERTNPRNRNHYFVIECKRLGTTLPGSPFNKNYVENGVLRFVREDDGYAKGEKSALMIGYVQSMEFDDILEDVNKELLPSSIPGLTQPTSGWQVQNVNQMVHTITRTSPSSPLLLYHLWLDLRGCCVPTPSKTNLPKSNKKRPYSRKPDKASSGASKKVTSSKSINKKSQTQTEQGNFVQTKMELN
jgi:hypothetical protein